jgi:hypothetical protein
MASTKGQVEIHPHQFHGEKFPLDAVHKGDGYNLIWIQQECR